MYDEINAICGIYEIVNNINNKKYIGQSIDIMSRWKTHQNALNRNGSNSRLLQRAWNKYGSENFSMNILETCDESMLDELEVKYIELYDTRNPKVGCNIESGGNKQKHLSEDTKQRLRDSKIGKHHTEEVRRKMSESRTGEKNGMYGKHHTEEARKRISEKAKLRKGRPATDKQREAARQANLGKIVSIETRQKIREKAIGRSSCNKNLNSVYCVELNEIFDTPSDAGKVFGIRSGNIIACCEHKRKTCGGYHWEYANNINPTNT